MQASIPLVAGVATGGMSVIPHMGIVLGAGLGGLFASNFINRRGKSRSLLYDAQLISAVKEFNDQLSVERGYTPGSPFFSIDTFRNMLSTLHSQPPHTPSFMQLSNSELNSILDAKTDSNAEKQRTTRKAVLGAAAIGAVWAHTFNSDAVIQPTETTPSPTTTPHTPAVKSWLSNFFSFNGVDGTRFNTDFLKKCVTTFNTPN